ncbi:MAG: DUF922 domain-containing protein [Aquabacterium sp.]
MAVDARRGNIRRGTYNVSGATLALINRAIERSGPRDPNDGRRYSGVCICTYRVVVSGRDWAFETESSGPPVRVRCTLGNGSVVADCRIQTPRLTSRLTGDDAAEWTRFQASVVDHENGHIDEYMVEGRAIAAEINSLSATGEGRNEREAQRAAQQQLAQLIQRNVGARLAARANAAAGRYDGRNQHGRSQGAVLRFTIR